ncbi:hypothetical protein DM02DRAFT_620222 [Periconia macrospinosa]|uniref:Uncharacterized protein n=1 Tax=Periconia macrospinosa TaxID=97972 RepID=A0A2V1D1N8_9PLEO|nr:hypothetical protein DM02DRAFT_620222 [Periconia macrospinosa]
MASQTEQGPEATSTNASTTHQTVDQVAEIRRWFRPAEDSEIYSQVQAYLSASLDLDTFVSKFTAPIDEVLRTVKYYDGELSGTWWDLGIAIFHSSKQIPYSDEDGHTRLVNLNKALKDHPDPQPNLLTAPAWKTLPWHYMVVREVFNDKPRSSDYVEIDSSDDEDEDDLNADSNDVDVEQEGDGEDEENEDEDGEDGEDDGSTSDEQEATVDVEVEANFWANFNYHLARLTDDGVQDMTTYFAIWAVRDALEDNYDATPIAYDAYIPAAAAWMRGAGRVLYTKEVDLTPTDPSQGNPAGGGDLWTGVAGFAKDRWAFWKKRFASIAGVDGIREGTRRTAKEAIEWMEKAERDVDSGGSG